MQYHCLLTSSPPSYLFSSACFITLLFLFSDFDCKLLGWQLWTFLKYKEIKEEMIKICLEIMLNMCTVNIIADIESIQS